MVWRNSNFIVLCHFSPFHSLLCGLFTSQPEEPLQTLWSQLLRGGVNRPQSQAGWLRNLS